MRSNDVKVTCCNCGVTAHVNIDEIMGYIKEDDNLCPSCVYLAIKIADAENRKIIAQNPGMSIEELLKLYITKSLGDYLKISSNLNTNRPEKTFRPEELN